MSDLSDWLANQAPISRKNAAESVFEHLQSSIASGQVPVGTRLPSEAQLATTFKVSRPIVREALRSLQTLGLTQTRTGSGTFVLRSDPDVELVNGGFSARDLIEARPHIEIPAAAWAAVRRTDAQAEQLLALCHAMDEEEDPYKWVQLDSEFHSRIAASSGNALFAKIVDDARGAMTQQSALVNMMAQRRLASNIEHRQIAVAIHDREQDHARLAMDVHLSKVRSVLAGLLGDAQPVG